MAKAWSEFVEFTNLATGRRGRVHFDGVDQIHERADPNTKELQPGCVLKFKNGNDDWMIAEDMEAADERLSEKKAEWLRRERELYQ